MPNKEGQLGPTLYTAVDNMNDDESITKQWRVIYACVDPHAAAVFHCHAQNIEEIPSICHD